jgi:hypothetical protein
MLCKKIFNVDLRRCLTVIVLAVILAMFPSAALLTEVGANSTHTPQRPSSAQDEAERAKGALVGTWRPAFGGVSADWHGGVANGCEAVRESVRYGHMVAVNDRCAAWDWGTNQAIAPLKLTFNSDGRGSLFLTVNAWYGPSGGYRLESRGGDFTYSIQDNQLVIRRDRDKELFTYDFATSRQECTAHRMEHCELFIDGCLLLRGKGWPFPVPFLGSLPLIADTLVVPPRDPKTNLPARGRVQPVKVEGSDAYTLFVIGKTLPTKASEMQSLQGADRDLFYEPQAYLSDYKAGKLSSELKQAWEDGLAVYSKGLDSTQMAKLLAMPALLLRVKLTPGGIMPGRKSFKINGAEGGWFLDQGNSKGKIRILAELNDNPDGKPTTTALGGPNLDSESIGDSGNENLQYQTKAVHRGECIVIEIRSDPAVDAKEVRVVLGSGETWSRFDEDYDVPAKAVAGQRGVFRTERIRILEPLNPLLDAANAKEREPETLYMAAEPGTSIHAVASDPHALMLEQPVVSTKVLPDPKTCLWFDALQRAAKADGLFEEIEIQNWNTLSGQTAEKVTNTILTQVLFKTRLQYVVAPAYTLFIQKMYGTALSKGDVIVSNKITIGNQAAMILMRDHFVRMMSDVLEDLDKVQTGEQRIRFMRELIENASNPARDITVSGPHTVSYQGGHFIDYHPLWRFLKTSWIPERENKERVVRQAFLEGFQRYRKSVQDSRDRARNTPDKDIDALLAIVGNGFDNVVENLKPLLVRPVTDPTTGALRWVTDYSARDEVSNLNKTFDAIRAQKDYSAIDTQVALALASLAPFVGPGGIIRTIASILIDVLFVGTTAAGQLPEFIEKEEEFEFARGAVPVLGPDRFYMADLQRTPAWTVGINFLVGGLSALGNAKEVFKTMSLLSKQRAARIALAVAEKIKQSRIKALTSASEEEVASFLACAGGVEIKEAEQGVAALTAEEQKLKDAVEALQKEITQKTALTQDTVISQKPLEAAAIQNVVDPVPLVRPHPTKPDTFTLPNGQEVKTVKTISERTQFFTVHVKEGEKEVYKFLKEVKATLTEEELNGLSEAEIALAKLHAKKEKVKKIWEGIKKAKDTLIREEIPHLEITELEEAQGYLAQEYLPEKFAEGEESFVVKRWLERETKLPKRTIKLASGDDYSFNPLTPEMEDAIAELVQKMKRTDIGFEDFKSDNIYIRRIKKGVNKGKLECGVLDVDRIAKWGDFTEAMNKSAWYFEHLPKGFRVYSLEEAVEAGEYVIEPRRLTFDEFWEAVFESRGFVVWNEATESFESGTMSIEKAQQILPGLKRKGKIHLNERKPIVPPKPRIGLLFQHHWLPKVGKEWLTQIVKYAKEGATFVRTNADRQGNVVYLFRRSGNKTTARNWNAIALQISSPHDLLAQAA